jgi:exopolysaccharide biosynthesis polyprenyl glycosylphosphotransferase
MINTAPRANFKAPKPARVSLEMVHGASERAPFPLRLQRRARVTLRTHLLRGVIRVTVLAAADITTLLVLRLALRLVRDSGLFGPAIAQGASRLIPQGTFPQAQFIVAICFGLALKSAYGAGDRRRDVGAIFSGAGIGLGLIFWSSVWRALRAQALFGFAIAAVLIGIALVLERLTVDAVTRRVRPASEDAPRTLLVGVPEVLRDARSHPALADLSSFEVVASFDVFATDDDAADLTERLVTLIVREGVDTVVLCGHYEADLFRDLIEIVDAAGCHVYALPRATELAGVEPQLVWRRGAPLIQLTRPGLRGQHLVAKRALDIAITSVAIVTITPLLLAVACAVKLTSRGPVLFRQRRVGRGGRLFWILKFRSMVVDAEAQRAEVVSRSVYSDQRLFKIVRDPRVTPIGEFLRASSLDELPQLWNVLKGEMSLVGPRPPLPSEVQLYADRHYARFQMKPGITGPWQVNGRNRITDFEKVVRLETEYMWQWSIGRDMGILLRTIPAVLKGDGAH